MLPNRNTIGQSSAIRKSRLEGKPSMLPKPRRPGSTDRLSTEVRRPSTTGHRSSSAEPARITYGTHLGREASATKLSINSKSRSQTGEARYGQAITTPLRSSNYARSTTTPLKTPSEDRKNRSWQTSLERALAFVTIKDQRPVSNASWQRAECARVSEALAARGISGGLLRPLTIARFVDIVGGLLTAICKDMRLSTDNYVAKLPHLCKRLLYPGIVTKSWLQTVNTLHAFPHALALISYLLDLLSHIEMPVLDEWLYLDQSELARIRRDHVYKCLIRLQDPDNGCQYDDLNENYLENLKQILGNNEEKIEELQQVIKKYESQLEVEAEEAARAEEAQRVQERDKVHTALRSARAARRDVRTRMQAEAARSRELADGHRQLDADIERAERSLEQVRSALETQPLSVAERARLLDDVDYATRVNDSKRALAEQIAKMVTSKETELAFWQKKTLDSCQEYKHLLIHLSVQCPELGIGTLAIDENELMETECAARLDEVLEVLRNVSNTLTAKRAEKAREKGALGRKRAALLEETRAKIAEMKSTIQREKQFMDAELASETSEASAWADEKLEIANKLEELKAWQDEYARVDSELEFWEKQDLEWRTKLSELKEHIASQRRDSKALLVSATEKRVRLMLDTLTLWKEKLGR